MGATSLPDFANAEAAALRFFSSSAVGAPRLSVGRSGSASACASATAGDGAAAAGGVSEAGRFRTGRSESASASDDGADAEADVSAAGRFRTGRLESAGSGADDEGAGTELDEGEEVGPEEGADPADGSSPDLSLGLARLNTGGPSGGSGAGFDITALFFAAASFAAAIALAVCQVPSPSQVLLPCSAEVTVNNPCETPARMPSYTVPLSRAMGTGAAL